MLPPVFGALRRLIPLGVAPAVGRDGGTAAR